MRAAPLDLHRLEAFLESSDVRFTSLERVVFPATRARGAVLKAHVVDYHLRVAGAMVPHVRGRPLVFRRYHAGIGGGFFYTKDWSGERVPSCVRTVRVWSESREEPLAYALAEDAASLAWVAQTGAVEVNPWLARLGPDPGACASEAGVAGVACGLDRPDVLAFDLDPYARAAVTGRKGDEAGGEPGLAPEDWARAVEAALELRDALRSLGVASFPKTSGKRGVHVLVPLVPDAGFDAVRVVARRVGEHLAARRPDLVTLSYDLRERMGRVFLDVNQNVRGKTLAAAYSLRPTPEATVSTPVSWDEIARVSPAQFDLVSVPQRVAAGVDPWSGFEAARRRLADVLGS